MPLLVSFCIFILISCSSFQKQGDSLSKQGEFRTSVTKYDISWPVKSPDMSRGFSTWGRGHFGLDLRGRRGTKILSSHDGKVIYTGKGFRGYGKLVIVEHPNNYATFYAHLNKIKVKQGQLVSQNQVLGTMGATGNARGVHLHFELRINKKAVDPMQFLP